MVKELFYKFKIVFINNRCFIGFHKFKSKMQKQRKKIFRTNFKNEEKDGNEFKIPDIQELLVQK
jgi:hypothetical protein